MIYFKENTGLIGTPKHGLKPLNYFVFTRVDINPTIPHNEIIGATIESKKSYVYFRFHSEIKYALEPIKWKGMKLWHERSFQYNGIDKNEKELILWALNTPGLVANDGITTIYGAKEDEHNSSKLKL
jgi:hypothetical protein